MCLLNKPRKNKKYNTNEKYIKSSRHLSIMGGIFTTLPLSLDISLFQKRAAWFCFVLSYLFVFVFVCFLLFPFLLFARSPRNSNDILFFLVRLTSLTCFFNTMAHHFHLLILSIDECVDRIVVSYGLNGGRLLPGTRDFNIYSLFVTPARHCTSR